MEIAIVCIVYSFLSINFYGRIVLFKLCCSSFHLETSSWDEFVEDASKFVVDLVVQLFLSSNAVEDVWVL